MKHVPTIPRSAFSFLRALEANRDVRFSKDKSPYKTNWGGHFTRAGRQRRGGYYYHFEPGNSQLVGAFWGPSTPDLRLIREDIAFDDRPLRKIITSKKFVDAFGSLQGEQLKRAPAGFDPDHPAADLLRYKPRRKRRPPGHPPQGNRSSIFSCISRLNASSSTCSRSTEARNNPRIIRLIIRLCCRNNRQTEHPDKWITSLTRSTSDSRTCCPFSMR